MIYHLKAIFFSLSSDIVYMKFRQKLFKLENYNHFYFFSMDILVTNQCIKLRFSACILNILL